MPLKGWGKRLFRLPRTTSLWLLAALALVVAVIGGWCARTRSTATQNAIDHLVSLEHGLGRLSPQDKELLAAVRKNPGRYLPLLKTSATLPYDRRIFLSEEQQRRWSNSILVLAHVGTPEALAIVESAHVQVLEALEPEWSLLRRFERGERRRIPASTQALRDAQNFVLDALVGARSTTATIRAIELIRVADYSTAINALEYLLHTARGDTAVVRAAQQAVADSGSAVHGDPSAQALLRALASRSFGGPVR